MSDRDRRRRSSRDRRSRSGSNGRRRDDRYSRDRRGGRRGGMRSYSSDDEYDRKDRVERREVRSPRRPRYRGRFDSPPKESAVIANLHGLNDDPTTYRQIRELNAAAEGSAAGLRSEQARLAKELYIGNIPGGITVFTLIDRLNDVLVEMGATVMAGKPILSGWLGGEGQFAFVQLRTVEECNNALSLNGYSLDGYSLKVGRPKGAVGALTDGTTAGTSAVHGTATQFSLDDAPGLGVTVHVPLEESTKVERLVLVGAPLEAVEEGLLRTLKEHGELKYFAFVDSPSIHRKSVLFEYEDPKSQRKLAAMSAVLVYDRDYPLAVLRQAEAIEFGFISVQDELFSRGLNRASVLKSRIVWMINFPPIPIGMEADLISEFKTTCSEFGRVENVKLLHVQKDAIKETDLQGILGDTEPIVVVEFESVNAAIKCKRYISGATCKFFSGEKYLADNFEVFEQPLSSVGEESDMMSEQVDTDTDTQASSVYWAPKIVGGKVVSAIHAITAAHRATRKLQIAPEDLDVID